MKHEGQNNVKLSCRNENRSYESWTKRNSCWIPLIVPIVWQNPTLSRADGSQSKPDRCLWKMYIIGGLKAVVIAQKVENFPLGKGHVSSNCEATERPERLRRGYLGLDERHGKHWIQPGKKPSSTRTGFESKFAIYLDDRRQFGLLHLFINPTVANDFPEKRANF